MRSEHRHPLKAASVATAAPHAATTRNAAAVERVQSPGEASPDAEGPQPILAIRATDASIRRFAALLYAVVLAVVAASLGFRWFSDAVYDGFPVYQLERLFHLNREQAAPTWVSAALLLAAGFVVALIARDELRQRNRFRWHWLGLASILVLMSADEVAGMHEMLSDLVRNNFGFDGLLFYAWVVPVGVALALLGVAYLPFVLALPRRVAIGCVAAATMAIAGGLVLEMFGGWYHANDAMGHPAYLAIMTGEETLELIAWVTLLHAMLLHRVLQDSRSTPTNAPAPGERQYPANDPVARNRKA